MKRQYISFAFRLLSCFVIAGSIGESPASAADAYLPASDDEVLETLPSTLLSSRSELSSLRRKLADNPRDVNTAASVASLYMQMGSQEGDPRYFGYAQAALEPWWEVNNPPAAILRLRAKLKEKDHQYDRALDDLKTFLEHEPQDIQAWIEVSNIYRVQGKYDKSQQACDRLGEFAGDVVANVGLVPLLISTGQAEKADKLLADMLPIIKRESPETLEWVLTEQAEAARALGRDEQAERHYKEGLANNPANLYLLRACADFLLDQNRTAEVLPLLEEHTTDNGVLLLAAIAARRTGKKKVSRDFQTQLENRFEEIRLRGSEPHGRFESRCALELQDDAQKALTLALDNWEKQKEMNDTRNVLAAAIAANDPQAAQPVVRFLKQNGNQDVDLQELVEQLEEME
ncbi:tetratricopeptide repeat protein [Bythopirellula goksoeyrii]|uniref:Tetratricopeptide repeat protein n=1 Tax=Bythopirellula goksoeyrii TaxID=1400387 RepID=A0A5B9Q5X5_9BACT|nr:hypothetical protein [Bythopirellula goksoeyrii]QEG34387.1 Tetratricopeptide repeat protein [Bythopirellula goksoeyrii]